MDDTATRLTTSMAERLVEEQRSIANALRRIADEVDSAERSTNLRTLHVSYGSMAKQIVHSVMWGVANLGIDHFVGEAAELDVLIAREAD